MQKTGRILELVRAGKQSYTKEQRMHAPIAKKPAADRDHLMKILMDCKKAVVTDNSSIESVRLYC